MAAERLDRVLTAVLAVSAVVLAATKVRQEFFSSAEAHSVRLETPVIQADWTEALPVGIRVGDRTAPVTMVVFSDLECPACRAFHKTARQVLQQHRNDVSMVFVHFPLPSHRFAVQAAQAAECADAQGRFVTFIDAVFSKQDSLGIKTWASYARDARATDTASIAECARNPAASKRVEAGRELALRWQLRGTPTVMINGRRYGTPPTVDEINRAIEHALKDSKSGVGARGEATSTTSAPDGGLRAWRPPTPRAYLSDSNLVARNVMRRLFDGIQLSNRQYEEGIAIVKRTWRQQFEPKSGTVIQQFADAETLVVARDAALRTLLESESDQARFERNADLLSGRASRRSQGIGAALGDAPKR